MMCLVVEALGASEAVSGGEEVLEEAGAPLLGDVDLVLQVPAVRRLGVLDLPTEVLYLRFQLSLLVLELKRISFVSKSKP